MLLLDESPMRHSFVMLLGWSVEAKELWTHYRSCSICSQEEIFSIFPYLLFFVCSRELPNPRGFSLLSSSKGADGRLLRRK